MASVSPDLAKHERRQGGPLQKGGAFVVSRGGENTTTHFRDPETLSLLLEQIVGTERTNGLHGSAMEAGIVERLENLGALQGLRRIALKGIQFTEELDSFLQAE